MTRTNKLTEALCDVCGADTAIDGAYVHRMQISLYSYRIGEEHHIDGDGFDHKEPFETQSFDLCSNCYPRVRTMVEASFELDDDEQQHVGEPGEKK
jgi:hypothetical protein